MSFEADLKSHLQAAVAISSLVADRITPELREENATLPAATYSIISNDPHMNLDGMDTSLRAIRVQIDCWAKTYSQMLALGDAVRSRMNTAATSFKSVVLATQSDDFEPDTKLYRRSQDFSCWYKAS